MMPADSRMSNTEVISADMGFGNCQNCSVLHQNLNEYVSSFLALKKKIIASDESVRLHQQLEELQIRLVTLEKKTTDYESLQEELEDKKEALKSYGQMIEEMGKMKQENCDTMTKKNQLEGQLKEAKEQLEIQSLENSRLTRKVALVENELLKTQASLNKSQAEADRVEKLTEENAKLSDIKATLENKVRMLKDSVCSRDRDISHLTKYKILQEGNIDDLQARLLRLERERTKADYRSTSAQVNTPQEPEIDKEKIRLLLENLWACVEPQQQHFPDSLFKQVIPSAPQTGPSNTSQSASQKIEESRCFAVQTEAPNAQLNLRPDLTAVKHQSCPQSRSAMKKRNHPKKSKRSSKEHKAEESSVASGNPEVSYEEFMAFFKPLPPCISPLPDSVKDMPSMETDIREQESHMEVSDDIVPFQQGEILLNTNSETGPCPKSLVITAEENSGFTAIRTQEVEQVSCGSHSKNSGQDELRDVAEMEAKNGADDEEMHCEKDVKTGQERTTVQLVSASSSSLSSTSSSVHLVDVTSSVENDLGKSNGDPPASATTVDVDTNLGDDTGAQTDTADDGEPPINNMTVTISEEDGNVPLMTSSTIDSVREAEILNTGQCAKMGKTQGLTRDSENVIALKDQEKKGCVIENTELQEDVPCMPSSSSNLSSVSDGKAEERVKKDESIKPLGEEDENETQETRAGDLRTFHPVSPVQSGPSANTSLLKEDGAKSHNDLKANVDVPSKNVDCTENLNGDHGPLTSDTDSGKSGRVETGSNLTKLKVGANTELISEDKSLELLTSLDAESTDSKDNAQPNKCQSATPTLITSLKQSVAATNVQETPTESQTDGQEKVRPHGNQEEEPGSVGGSTAAQPRCIGRVLSDIGPPLPCLLTPLSTPPKMGKSISPRQAIEKLSFPSPMDRLASPSTPLLSSSVPNSQQVISSSHDSPVPPNRVPSSPLQFGSATPEHAVPVPGRLPSSGMIASPLLSSSPSQENSMRILDTMYPELSAHARTLSILKGNVNFIQSPENGKLAENSTIQASGFKAINSTSTAFTKTEAKGEKRPSISLPESKNSKCLRLDNGSSLGHEEVPASSNRREESEAPQPVRPGQLTTEPACPPIATGEPLNLIVNALNKMESQCFDLLPVLQSHVYVGNLPKKPVLRNEEKEVIAEICQSSLADDMILAVLNKLKGEKRELSSNYVQALCRVYTGLCRQKGDWEKALLLAYSILTEDFPDAAKLILFMVTTWPSVLSRSSSLCQAIHTVTKLKAEKSLLSCLTAFLGWEKHPPCDIDKLISTTLSDARSGSSLSFAKDSRHGDDLGSQAWEYVLTLHILCAHKKWQWTYENLLGKELWPLMNSWMTQPKDQKEVISDVTVATVLRLIGLLGQLGIKERCVSSVKTVASIINTFGRHAPVEGVPWEVQLAAIYSIYDLSPCNPKQALDALAGWRSETSQHIPPAVTSCMNQLASICRQVNG